ncbi:MAG: hypothetical protein H6Q19_1651 [Bacteroidetes bacterium]|nr:hypothetical protein [Bacteroidota bacterium]
MLIVTGLVKLAEMHFLLSQQIFLKTIGKIEKNVLGNLK